MTGVETKHAIVALETAIAYALRQAENAKVAATKGGIPVQSYYAAKVAAYEDMAATLGMAVQVLASPQE